MKNGSSPSGEDPQRLLAVLICALTQSAYHADDAGDQGERKHDSGRRNRCIDAQKDRSNQQKDANAARRNMTACFAENVYAPKGNQEKIADTQDRRGICVGEDTLKKVGKSTGIRPERKTHAEANQFKSPTTLHIKPDLRRISLCGISAIFSPNTPIAIIVKSHRKVFAMVVIDYAASKYALAFSMEVLML
ncbi:MAG: hypothetical protein IJX53_04795 [Clostridia bacterium]|nr:hypothetical protein [Clostridia bacterium]